MLGTLLLLIAVVLFAVAAVLHRTGNGWLVPLGLALWALTGLIDGVDLN